MQRLLSLFFVYFSAFLFMQPLSAQNKSGFHLSSFFGYPLTVGDAATGELQLSINKLLPVEDAGVNTLTGTATISNTAPRIDDVLIGLLVDGNNTGALSYVWKVGGVQAATTQTYTVLLADLNKTITLEITSTAQIGTVTSAVTAAVKKKLPPTPPSPPSLAITPTHNSVTLTANALYEFSEGGATWQTSAKFTGLMPETDYTRDYIN